MTTLVTGENDWDLMMTLSRDAGADKDGLAITIDRDGPRLAAAVEALLRTESVTRPATDGK